MIPIRQEEIMPGSEGTGSIAEHATVYPGRNPNLLNQGRLPEERAFLTVTYTHTFTRRHKARHLTEY